MTPELKAKWAADLLSGKYKQTRGQLIDEKGYRCCLGVLVASAGHRITRKYRMTESLSGLALTEFGMTPQAQLKFCKMNDVEELTFEQIAEVITSGKVDGI